jgi:uncharacterized lipoprotein YmbA
MKAGLVCAILGNAAMMSACVSTAPMRFYVLTASAESAEPAPGAGPVELRIGRLTIPGELDRPEIVRGLAGNQLQIADQDRWAAPLDDMIRRVLNEDLAHGKGSGTPAQAAPAVAAPGSAARNVGLDIEQLLPAADCSVSLRATWTAPAPSAAAETSASASGSKPVSSGPAQAAAQPLRGTIEFRTTAATGACAASDVPAALSSALGELAERLRAAADAR